MWWKLCRYVPYINKTLNANILAYTDFKMAAGWKS
jgi:hypothetical protein